MQGLFDTHAHLNDKKFSRDIGGAIARAAAEGVERITCVAWDMASSRMAVEIAGRNKNVWATVGVHPHDANFFDDQSLAELAKLAEHPKVVALGEIGLDFYRDLSPRPVQESVFRAQLQLAKELNMPVVIHDRDAGESILKVLEDVGLPAAGGVMHCFSEDLRYARRIIELGMYIGIAGTVTYAKSQMLADVVKAVPEDRILIETDSPYLTPVPHRGSKMNEPAYVRFVAEKIAELRGADSATIARITTENAMRFYRIGLKQKF